MNKRLLAIIPVLLVVFLCSYNAFANDNAHAYQVKSLDYTTADGNARIQINTSVMWADRETAMYTNSGTYLSYSNDVLMTIIVTNLNADQDIYCDNLWSFGVYVDSMQLYGTQGENIYSPYKIIHFEPIRDDNFVFAQMIGQQSNSFTFQMFPDPMYGNPDARSRVVVPRNSSVVAQFVFSVYGYNATGITAGDTSQFFIPTAVSTTLTSSTWTKGNYPINAPYYSLAQINDKVSNLVDGYTNNTGKSNTVSNDSNSMKTQSDTVHSQESSYYTQTNTALNNTGLSNYSFSNDMISGINKHTWMFEYVWNKLGSFTVVYGFSMTLSLALMIIRHVRPIKKKGNTE